MATGNNTTVTTPSNPKPASLASPVRSTPTRKRRTPVRSNVGVKPTPSPAPAPTTVVNTGGLWNRAEMVRHLRLAGHVMVYVPGLNAEVPVKKSHLEDMVKGASDDALFHPPELRLAGNPQVVVVIFR